MASYKNYIIAEYPQDEFFFDFIFLDKNNKKKWYDIVNEKNLYGIVNLGYFNMNTFALENNTKYKGDWIYGPSYQDFGITIDQNGKLGFDMNTIDITTLKPTDNLWTYTAGCPPVVIDGVDQNRISESKNGNTMIGFKKDMTPVILLCGKDEGQTSDEGIQILKDAGCINIFRMDGSWSSSGRLMPGEVVQPSQYRYDKYYLGIYKREFNPLRSKYKVVIDPYGIANSTKDPNMWNICTELKKMLLIQGIECIFSHYDGSELSNDLRIKSANCWNTSVFISLGEEDIGNYNITITTSSPGTTATRNTIANDIRKNLIDKNYIVRDVNHMAIDILAKPEAPAILIKYNKYMNITDTVINEICESITRAILKPAGIDWIDIAPIIPTDDIFTKLQLAGLIPHNINKDTTFLTWGEFCNILENLDLIKDN